MSFLAAVAVVGAGAGGFASGIGAFAIFAATMMALIFVLAFAGASSRPALAVSLRLWGRRIQIVTGLMVLIVGGGLVYAGLNPGALAGLLLSG